MWKPTPRPAASAASSSIGSMTPCGKLGAEPTTTTVRSVTASAVAATSALHVGAHRHPHGLMPK